MHKIMWSLFQETVFGIPAKLTAALVLRAPIQILSLSSFDHEHLIVDLP